MIRNFIMGGEVMIETLMVLSPSLFYGKKPSNLICYLTQGIIEQYSGSALSDDRGRFEQWQLNKTFEKKNWLNKSQLSKSTIEQKTNELNVVEQ